MSLGADFYAWEFDLLNGEGDRQRVIEAVRTCLLDWKGWDVLNATASLDSGAVPNLIEQLGDGGATDLSPVQMIGYIISCPPAGSTFEEAIAHSAMTRKRQLKRHLKKLLTLGTPAWTVLEPDAPIDRQLKAFDEFLVLEASGWKGRSGKPVQRNPKMTSTYQTMIRKQMIFQHRLEVDGVLAAANVGIKFNVRFLSERFSFNEQFGEVSPGHLMTMFILRDMANRGCKDIDRAGTHVGQPTYKTSWTDISYPISAYVVVRAGVRGRMLHFMWTTGLPKLRSIESRVRELRSDGFRRRTGALEPVLPTPVESSRGT